MNPVKNYKKIQPIFFIDDKWIDWYQDRKEEYAEMNAARRKHIVTAILAVAAVLVIGAVGLLIRQTLNNKNDPGANTDSEQTGTPSDDNELDSPEEIFNNIDEIKSPFSLTVFDGESVSLWELPDDNKTVLKKEILELLKQAEFSSSSLPDKGVQPPFYGLNMSLNPDEHKYSATFYMGFSEGYVRLVDGRVYKTALDPEQLIRDYGYVKNVNYEPLAPGGYRAFAGFLKNNDGYVKEWLDRRHSVEYAGRAQEERAEVEVSLQKWDTEKIVSVTVTNRSDKEMIYSGDIFFALLVKIDGEWYDVPYAPLHYDMYSGLVGRELLPGASRTQDYPIKDYYGDIPKGEYRIVDMDAQEGYYDFTID